MDAPATDARAFRIDLGDHRLAAVRVDPAIVTPGRAPLVLLHEGLGTIGLWRDFPAALAAATGREALVYDRRGYGKSDPFAGARGTDYLHVEAHDVLPRVLDAAGIERAVLVGHSDGGTIALLAAGRFPDRIVGAAVEATHVFVEDVTIAGIHRAVAGYVPHLRDRLNRHHGGKTDAVFAAWADTWLSEGFRDWNIEDELRAIACPLLAIQGADDEYGSEAQVLAICRGAGNATPLMIPHCAHVPHHQARETVLTAMTEFIAALD